MPILEEDFIQTGKVKYVVRDYPLQGHDNASMAAQATHCAGDQGQFWKMSRMIFRHFDDVTREGLLLWAEQVGVTDLGAFADCLDGELYAEEVNADVLDGNRAGMYSTPSFYFGYTDTEDPANAPVRVNLKLEGAYPYADFRKQIERMLAEMPTGGAAE